MPARTVIALLAAALLALAGCGGDDTDRGEESARDFTLAEVIERPPLPGETVGVEGEASIVPDAGFILSDDQGNAIFVEADPGEAEDVEDGEMVRVVGDLARIDQEQSNQLAEALTGTRANPPGEVTELPQAQVRTNEGALFIDLARVEPVPGGGG